MGIVGFGSMGRRRLAAFGADPAWQIEAVADIESSARARVPAGPGVDETLGELLKRPLDALVVAVPTGLAADLCLQGLEAGLHVFCEKPPARTTRELAPVLAAAAARPEQVLMYGFNHRLHASVRRAVEAFRSGAIGQIRHLRGRYTKTGPPGPDEWRGRAEAGGGSLLDQGIHLLDLIRLFVEDVVVSAAKVDGPPGQERHVEATLVAHGGCDAVIISSAVADRTEFVLEIQGERGTIRLDGLATGSGRYAPETVLVDASGSTPLSARFESDDSWVQEAVAFKDAIETPSRAGRHGTPADARSALQLVEQIYALGGAS